MKFIWCSGLPDIHARLPGGPSAKYEHTSKFTLASHRSFLRKTNKKRSIFYRGGVAAVLPVCPVMCAKMCFHLFIPGQTYEAHCNMMQQSVFHVKTAMCSSVLLACTMEQLFYCKRHTVPYLDLYMFTFHHFYISTFFFFLQMNQSSTVYL